MVLVRIVEMMHLGSQKAREGSLVGLFSIRKSRGEPGITNLEQVGGKRSKDKGPENGI